MSKGDRNRQGRRASGNPHNRKSSKYLAAVPNGRGRLSRSALVAIRRALHREWVPETLHTYRYGSADAEPGPGRRETLSFEAILVVLLAIAELGEAPHLSNIANAIRFRLSRECAANLGIPADTYALQNDAFGRTFWDLDEEEWDTAVFEVDPAKLYERVQSAFTRMTNLLEPYPGVATREARSAGDVQAAIDALDPADVAMKKERLENVGNRVVRASLHRLPRASRRRVMEHWRGAVAIDGTNVPIHTHKSRGGVTEDNRRSHPEWTHHPEAMGGWYIREGNHAGYEDDGITKLNAKSLKDKKWAYELHVAVAIKSVKSKGPVPSVALGFAFGAASGQIGENSLTALLSATQVAHDIGVKPDIVVADRAILPGSKWETFQKPARALGWRFVMEFRKDQNGNMVPKKKPKESSKGKGRRGAIIDQVGQDDPLRGTKMVDGEVYCPGTPQHLIDAKRLFEYDEIDKATLKDRLAAREDYKATRAEQWNTKGQGRYSCPAATLGGKLKCPLRETLLNKPRTEVENPPEHPGEICTTHKQDLQITLEENTGKFALDLPYGSPDYKFMMGQRSVVESFNSSIKEEDHEALDEGARRQVRGFAKQAVLVAALVFARNVRALRTFIHAYGHTLEPQPTDPGPEHPSNPEGNLTHLNREDLPPPDRRAA